MASVEDRWMRTVRDENGHVVLTAAGKPKKERSDRYGKGLRWLVRWREPDGTPRKMSFRTQDQAEAHKSIVEADKLRGTYIDVRAGEETFGAYATRWLADQTTDPLTRQEIGNRLRRYVEPYALWKTQLRAIKPGGVQTWLRQVADVRTSAGTPLAASTRGVVFAHVSAILNSAVQDELIGKNPARASSVNAPSAQGRKIVPWSREWVSGMHSELPEQYRVFVPLAAGLGLRQGELFGLSPDDVDWLRGWVKVRRQVKIVGARLVFAPPKGGKEREVPLPATVRDELAAYLAAHPAKEVTLPWREADGKPTTVKLAVTTRESAACNRNHFNQNVWKPAQQRVGMPSSRENGMHALRHYYASVLLDAGENIKAVSEYLGHHSATVTLNYYAHLLPTSETRTRAAIDAVLGVPGAPGVPRAMAEGGVTSMDGQNSRNSSDSAPRSAS
ncbi:site-specific integrase [Amycolatopsis cynarae]|uniref:Site-specific integrase n=1 Tax=Amycolatopsis cynarae TaxID=2995223 RepID=A0ABY7AXL6_9PSEU|nr:site-specific integrase [Amycolatopsis sp. HUAS 11-8]WAL64467.1 site-specific integrase [Amycolatopsis sp. HUAS 11-8]